MTRYKRIMKNQQSWILILTYYFLFQLCTSCEVENCKTCKSGLANVCEVCADGYTLSSDNSCKRFYLSLKYILAGVTVLVSIYVLCFCLPSILFSSIAYGVFCSKEETKYSYYLDQKNSLKTNRKQSSQSGEILFHGLSLKSTGEVCRLEGQPMVAVHKDFDIGDIIKEQEEDKASFEVDSEGQEPLRISRVRRSLKNQKKKSFLNSKGNKNKNENRQG